MGRAKKTAVLVAALLLASLASRPAVAGGADEASGVATRRGNPSPSAAVSGVDNYVFQDEQINIDGGRDSVVKVLRVNQKNLVNDYVVGVFPINHAHPKEIRALFRMITYKEGGRAEVIRDKVGKKAFLQVICPKYMLPYIQKALVALDESWVKEDIDGSKQIYYKAKFRDVANINDIAEVPGGGDGETTEVDRAHNAIFKRGEPYRMKKWLSTAETVDVFPPQIVLDASVYEVELTNDVKLGLDYVAWKCGPGSNLFHFAYWGFHGTQKARNLTADGSFDPLFPARQLVSGAERLGARGRGHYAALNFLLSAEYLDFMVRKGRARLVTGGRLNVRHGESGTLELADQVIHFRRDPDGEHIASGSACPVEETCVDTDAATIGLVMEVTPRIGLETTQLEYELVVEDIVGNTPDGHPMTRVNVCMGTVLCRDGMPLCVGGLRRSEGVKSTAKMPFLGSLPVLGWLFGGEQNADHQTELVVVLTPQIILHSEVDKELARPEDKKVRAQAARKMPLRMLKTEYGFDQWLLEKN
ncbi:MAG: hypothetical protein KAX44_00605 [Candidatus Brocadiae bacterium]|nr:hypothetical protein [Candidatus Brocadiia bacterium]